MADTLTPEQRNRCMARNMSKNTRPEMIVRSIAHGLGLRFRLHRGDLPGKPDLTFPKYNAVVFVHGCFWHRHAGCRLASTPKTNPEFWIKKFKKNEERDVACQARLKDMNLSSLVIWECEVRERSRIAAILSEFLKLPPNDETLGAVGGSDNSLDGPNG